MTQQAVEILVGAAFPRMVWSCEVDGDGEALLEESVAVKLGAIVEGEGFEVVAMATDRTSRSAGDRMFLSCAQLLDDDKAGLAFYEREHAMAHVTAHHGIGFPVTDPASLFDLGRTLGDGALAGQDPSGISAAIALAPELTHDPGVAPQMRTGAFDPADTTIDGFVLTAAYPLWSGRARSGRGSAMIIGACAPLNAAFRRYG